MAADEPDRGEMRGEVGGDDAGEDGVQQGGADRAAKHRPTVTVADATSASCGATPKVPVLIAGAITMPRPILARISGPSTPAAWPVCGPSWPSWASQTIPPDAASILDAINGLGPNLMILACSGTHTGTTGSCMAPSAMWLPAAHTGKF